MSIPIPDWAKRGRVGWEYTGRRRPGFAIAPEQGQESVWDYPRPPRLELDERIVTVHVGDVLIARTCAAIRILETAGPPTFYLPKGDVVSAHLELSSGTSRCEWKGEARYWSVVVPGKRIADVAWSYPNPFPEYGTIRDYVSFYPAGLSCRVGDIPVTPQPGGFYGGWVTPEVVGPFKGEPGSENW